MDEPEAAGELAEGELGRNNDQLQRLNEWRVRFHATMSHEPRSLLQGTIGHTRSSQLDLPDDMIDARESVMAVRMAADHMIGIVNDLLDLCKLVVRR